MTAHAPTPTAGPLVLICGSRDWPDPAAIHRRVEDLPAGTVVLHGAAPGADTHAATAARTHGLTVRAFPADWRRHGRRAGLLRNLAMLDQHPDLVIAFWHNESRGTLHTIDTARQRGIPAELHLSASA